MTKRKPKKRVKKMKLPPQVLAEVLTPQMFDDENIDA